MAQSSLGQWDFNNGNLAGTSGGDMSYADFPGGATSQTTRFGTTTVLGISGISGAEALIMGFGTNINGMGYNVPMPSSPNGGGSLINEWTFIIDVYYPSTSSGQIRPLLDTDVSFGLSPGPEFVVNRNDGIGVSGGTSYGKLTPGTWNRVAIVNTAGEIRLFINGDKVGTVQGGGIDGAYALTPFDKAMMFGSTQTEAAPGFVNSIQFRDEALADGKLVALGSPSAAGIPTVIPPVPSYVQQWIPSGDVASRNTPVGVVINRGETTIESGTIVLKLDDVVVAAPTITSSDPLITVAKNGLSPFLPGTTHTLEISYTDSINGARTASTQFKAVLLFEDFESVALQDSVEERAGTPKVWTPTPPSGWTVDNSKMPGYGDTANDGVTEWAGITFAKNSFWNLEGQDRQLFTLGTGVIAVADPDEWEDGAQPETDEFGNALYFNSFLTSPEMDLTGVSANTIFVKFDSSWRPEGFDDWGGTNNQTAIVTVSYDRGQPQEIIHWDSKEGGPFYKTDTQNETVYLRLNNPAGATNMVLRFSLTNGANDWWWAFDNLEVSAGAAAPLITKQPESQLASEGTTATFSLTATGSEPMEYRWYFGGTVLPSATNASLSLANAQPANVGEYYAVVTNPGGSVTSSVVSLTLFNGKITDDLVVHLKFDGNLTDASGRGNTGQAVGSPTFEAGKVGQAVHITTATTLDTNSYVTLGYPEDLKLGSGELASDFSIAMWVRVVTRAGDKPFISNKDWDSGGNRGFVLANQSGGVKWNYRDDQSARRDSATVGPELNDGTWHHLAVTFDRTGSALTFVDGQQLNSTSIAPDENKTIGKIDTDDLGNSINIGQDGMGDYTDGGSSGIEMVTDDLGIWRRPLTSQEVAAIYNAGLQSKDLTQAVVGTPAIPPTITQEPADASSYEGESVKLTVAAAGTPPLRYQWYRPAGPIANATTGTYTIAALAAVDAGEYYLVVQNDAGSITSRVATITFLGAPPAPQITGQWDFNAGNLAATIGTALSFFDATVEADTQFGSTASFSLPNIAGAPAQVLYFQPSVDAWGGYVMPHGAAPNAGGQYVNRYTLIYDVLYPASSGGKWRALLQSNQSNSNDGDLFVNAGNGFGINGSYTGTVPTDSWIRLVAVFDLSSQSLRKYIDGVPVGSQNLGDGIDGRWSLDPTALLFADNDGETSAAYVNSVQFRNGAMSEPDILALGGVATDGIPGMRPSINAVTRQGDSLVITWSGQPGMKLQSTTALIGGEWKDVEGTTGASSATVPIQGAAGFFRLMQ